MLKFIVQGSLPGGYEIFANKTVQTLTFTCSCEAGSKGSHCKHRFALLAGQTDSILSGNEQDLALLHAMLSGSSIEARFRKICLLEREKEEIDVRLKAERKAIGREMGRTTS